jgi:hypothetical protein
VRPHLPQLAFKRFRLTKTTTSPLRLLQLTAARPPNTPAHPSKPPEIMSAPSLAPFIMKRPWLQKWMKPLSNWYCNAAGYRQLGLR